MGGKTELAKWAPGVVTLRCKVTDGMTGGRRLNTPLGGNGSVHRFANGESAVGPASRAQPPMGGMVPPPPPPPPPVPWSPVGFPAGPEGRPIPPPRKRRGRAIAAVIAVIVAVVIGGALGLRMAAPHRSAQPAPKPTTPDSASEGFVYRLLPATVFPTPDELDKGMDAFVNSALPVFLGVDRGRETTPPICSLEFMPASPTLWGKAISAAGQVYSDLAPSHAADPNWWTKTVLEIAVFRTSADAKATIAKLTDSINGCTMTYTDGTVSNNGVDPARYTVESRTPDGPNAISWVHTSNNIVGDEITQSPMKSSYAYRVVDNLAVFAIYHSIVPRHEASKAVDLLIANANARNHK